MATKTKREEGHAYSLVVPVFDCIWIFMLEMQYKIKKKITYYLNELQSA